MEIVKVTKDTAMQASYIYAMSWKTGYRGIVPQDYLDRLPTDRWADKLGKESYPTYREDFLLLSDSGKAVATSSVSAAREEAFRGWGEIMSIYVLPEEFRRGYGRMLFSHDCDRLREAGYRDLYLWALEDNLRARAFYEAMGFSDGGDRILQNIGGRDLTEVRYIRRG